VVLSLLGGIGALALAFTPAVPVLLVMAFVGMLNGTGTDARLHLLLSKQSFPDWCRTHRGHGPRLVQRCPRYRRFAGALAAALPLLLQRWLALPLLTSYRTVFFGCAFLGVVGAILYPFASVAVEVSKSATEATPHHVSPASKKVSQNWRVCFPLMRLAGISDGCTCCLLVFPALWSSGRKPGHPLLCCAPAECCLSSGAAWLARRIGLVKTMVFTHLPSSMFLVAAAFAPSLKVAIVLFLCREALVEMDVPTRQSYVAAVVLPNERTFASGIANLARNIFWAVGSSVAGFLMQNVAFSAPLVIGGGAKISYDLLLYRAFRNLAPPEEQST